MVATRARLVTFSALIFVFLIALVTIPFPLLTFTGIPGLIQFSLIDPDRAVAVIGTAEMTVTDIVIIAGIAAGSIAIGAFINHLIERLN